MPDEGKETPETSRKPVPADWQPILSRRRLPVAARTGLDPEHLRHLRQQVAWQGPANRPTERKLSLRERLRWGGSAWRTLPAVLISWLIFPMQYKITAVMRVLRTSQGSKKPWRQRWQDAQDAERERIMREHLMSRHRRYGIPPFEAEPRVTRSAIKRINKVDPE